MISKQKTMKKINLLTKLMLLTILLPYKIHKGLKKSAYLKVKKIMIEMNLL
jgi:hypothetical protein